MKKKIKKLMSPLSNLIRTASILFCELSSDIKFPDSPNFYRIKRVTNGMLSSELYREIYESAKAAKEGVFLDIGTGRGGSSISLALAIKNYKENSRLLCIDQFYQHRAKHPHRYTMESHPLNCIELNTQVYMSNLKLFGVEDVPELIVCKTTECGDRLPEHSSSSFIFIDVDGCIDRDFGVFYNLLMPGATLIIDDCSECINSHGRVYLEEYRQLRTKKEKQEFIDEKDDFFLKRILGKHYLTHLLVEYFLEKGFIEKEKIIGDTFFGKKRESIKHRVSFNEDDFDGIRDQILSRFIILAS